MNAIATQSAPTLVLDPTCLKRWSVKEYYRLYDLGLIGVNERCELISGQILLMAAKGTNHVVALQLLADLLRSQGISNTSIRTQDPIHLDDFSEPEPDLVVVRGTTLDYGEHHPYPTDVLLVVEVADSTLKIDSEIKDKLYAQANIPEYWVLDLKNRQLLVFINPNPTGYSDLLILDGADVVSPLALANIRLSVAEILPPEKKYTV